MMESDPTEMHCDLCREPLHEHWRGRPCLGGNAVMEFQLPPLPPPQPRRKLFGEQHRFCPNCGKALYDTRLTMDHVKSMMCGDACREDWEMKYARMILGKSAEEGK